MGGFELLEHTADIGVRARGATLEEVFEQATLGLAEVLGALRPGTGEAVGVAVTAGDPGALLVDWLNEVLWLHEVRGHAGVAAVRVERVAGDRADGTVSFSSTDRPAEGTFVKAVTYHRLRVGRDAGGWLAEVYLDV
jgi:SHS2 domain-containing protein